MLLRWKYSHPQKCKGSTTIHRGANNGKSTMKGNGDGEA
jgi:hypothetical protein